MEIHLIRGTIYTDGGRNWRTEDIHHPSWDAVEEAIRRLDGYWYPFVWLFKDVEAPEDAFPDLNILGGPNEFTLDRFRDDEYVRYYDLSRGDDEIEVWRSDQGYTCEAKYCCPSLEIVLRAAKYYCEHGALDPGLQWLAQ